MIDHSTGLTVISDTHVSKKTLKTIRRLFDMGMEPTHPKNPSLKDRIGNFLGYTIKLFKG